MLTKDFVLFHIIRSTFLMYTYIYIYIYIYIKKRSTRFKAFMESQFEYCPVFWMFSVFTIKIFRDSELKFTRLFLFHDISGKSLKELFVKKSNHHNLSVKA